MLQTLRSKILFYLVLISMIGILIVSFFIQYGFEESFNSYLDRNREKKIDRIITEIEKDYRKNGHFTSDPVYGLLHENAMTDQLYFQLYDRFGKMQMDTSSIRGMLNSFGLTEPEPDGENWHSKTYTLKVDNAIIGKLVAIYPEGLIDDEYTFIQTIQLYILAAVCLTIVLAIVFSMIFSKKLTSGLKKLSFAAGELQHHNLDIRIPLKGLPTEVKQIAVSFNNLAESLAKEEILRKQFTGDLAHELRTPLATLRSQIEAFQDGIWEPTAQRLQVSHEELMRLVRLVNELEKLLAAENPQIRLDKMELEAGSVLAALWEMFLPIFKEKGVGLQIEEPLQEEIFEADKDRLMQILSNVLNNALKYTPEGKNVTISVVTDKEGYVGFKIQDEGSGMAEEDIPHIFERFYRGDKSRDRKTGGVGIGLSIVKALMDAHKGLIKVKSRVNKGTSITLWFPQEE
ncbi:two-component sensor histidine kinase [Bacillus sp. AFS076308]|uniref:HAMP domain-containing sensor histidine kinase n=1 Tax=unclassified Bacillus (in: firmicutes) TaxID=185979 RepID=UPI000BF9E5D4|nr:MULTISPECIES: ATP-binding protein [unclassified Bacillus (in: firmicutes)]PFO02583.1 two-component sensor histidine kinase [Bacillus sp. AFS076308]PGV55476.1 two-component sensor histidine kinase [Bacillus sp. AFS037270]